MAGVHTRACEEANRRGNSRQARMTRQAAIAGTAETLDDDFLPLTWAKRVLHWLAAIALIPFCFVTMITIIEVLGDETMLGRVWYSTEFICFLAGSISILSWFIAGIANEKLLYLYVLGHEMTHATFVYLFFGRITAMHVSSDGGYIMTNKSNIVIALSPYFIPFWSAVLISLHSFATYFWEIPAEEFILMALLGFTWTFHVIWTLWMIPKDQPDLREHGIFLSLMIIILANLLLLSVMICATSSDIKLFSFIFEWWNNCLDLGEGLLRLKSSS